MKSREVIVVGAGPAGLVAAIAARQRGFDVTVLDARTPPIDKPCGEGILPRGVAALKSLGVSLPDEDVLPFQGIRFVDGDVSARADFANEAGFSMRRVKLHRFLIDRATEAGAELLWGARVVRMDAGLITTTSKSYAYRWLIGADGHSSQVRTWARLERPRWQSRRRFGFCSHFGVRPWSDVTEVHWANGCQIFVTPMKDAEVGVAVLSRDPARRLERAIEDFPELADKLRGSTRITKEAGDITSLTVLPAVARDRVALVGDASGTVDALTGHGLSLSFQQALPLAEAMSRGDLASYQAAHQKISAVPVLMTRLMLLMTASDWIRRRTIRLFQNSPTAFSKMLEIHTEAAPLSSVGFGDLANFGWEFLKA